MLRVVCLHVMIDTALYIDISSSDTLAAAAAAAAAAAGMPRVV
jgi:hypothetical protein